VTAHRHDAADVLNRHADVLVLMSSDAERGRRARPSADLISCSDN
jgi:hypothetical protein